MVDDENICSHCNGSGEGSYNGSICGWCFGSGEIEELNEEFLEPDETDYENYPEGFDGG